MDAVKDNAIVILKNLKDGTISHEDLIPEMRRVCITFLDDEGIRNEEIANTLHCSVGTIENDLRIIRNAYGNMITSVDYKAVLAMYLRDAAHYKKKAVLGKDYRLAWQIDNDLLDKLMELGFLRRAPDEMIIKTEKADDLTEEETQVIDAILMRVAARRNKRENAGLIGDGIKLLTGGGNGDNAVCS